MSDWTDIQLDLLRKLYRDGSNAWVARKINELTGSDFSRNAIIGKANRIGLARPLDERKTPKQRPPRKPKSGYYGFIYGPSIPPEPIIETPIPQDFLGISFEELNLDRQCRYPRGEDAPYLFCGQPKQEGSSYCPSCHRIAYTHRPHPKPVKYFPTGGQKVRAA